ncbi:MAG: M20/M25/M40 family metallo-hydrolase [Roseivirga sp.]|nr:M20/M25/M40 family metallo-hydrolase [Roseivirga sp.]
MKKQLTVLFALALFSFSNFTSCQQAPVIDEAEVTRIISTLAADDMEGRRTFTPGIDKAAKFIAGEFQKTGLEYLDGLNSYQQKFNMYSLTPESASVTINGKTIAEEDILASVSAQSFELKDVTNAQVFTIPAGTDFQATFNEARRAEGKRVVLVDPSHKNLFTRYKGFFTRANRVMELDAANGMVMAITKATSLKSVDIKVTNTMEENALGNVAAKITGNRTNEIVVFSGHYDHLGIRGVEGDTIYNGANDDASGTTAVLTLAKYFKDMGTKPERTIIFVAFTAEEMGGFGSRYFSQQLNPDEIVAMFNIEMIGKPAVSGPNTAWITGFDKSDFGTLLQKAVEGTEYEFYADPYPTQNLFYRSDNATLARLGVPAHTISTTPIDVDPDYHKSSDEVSTLDMAHMTNTIKAISSAAERIISGTDTPTRVDPAGLN